MGWDEAQQNWGSIAPGKIVEPSELTNSCTTTLRGDFGIAAVQYQRPIPIAAQHEMASLNKDARRRLEDISLNYRDGTVQSIYKKPAPKELIEAAEQCLIHFADTHNLKEANAWFWTMARGFAPHFDSIPTKIKGYWQLSEDFGLVGYSISRGQLNILSMTEDVDQDQLQGLIDRGHAKKITARQGDLFHFNDKFIHGSAEGTAYFGDHDPMRLLLSSKAFNVS